MMKKILEESTEPPANEPSVMQDECGDTLWDAVLAQEVDACELKNQFLKMLLHYSTRLLPSRCTTQLRPNRYSIVWLKIKNTMAKNFASIVFTNPVKSMQEKMGSRAGYARMERETYVNGLTENEIDFIVQRDSFYIASVGENDYPYIQHRGGPKGFVKVLDAKRIGFIDFRGNMQYITVGNIATNNNVALIMVDYPSRARLKILAKAEVVELKDLPSLHELLNLEAYKFKPERMMILHVEAYDWNCPQHITPRYTEEDIEEAFAAEREHIAKLRAEVKELKQKLKERGV